MSRNRKEHNVYVVEDTFDHTVWDAAATNPMASWAWGEARKKMGIDVLRIVEGDTKKPDSVFQMTFHDLPYVPYTVGYMPRTNLPSDDVLEAIRKEAAERNAVFVKIEPYVRADDVQEGAELKRFKAFKDAVTHSSHPLFPRWTQVIDLTPSEKDLMKNMKSKWRYNVRLGKRKGVTVEEMTDTKGFEIFADLYFATTARQDYAGHNYSYHKTVFETLNEHNMSRILIAFYKKEPLAAYHLFHFKDTLYYPYGGSSHKHRKVMASNVLMWEAMRLGKKLNAKEFDLWGSMDPDYDRSQGGWAGFTRFKEGFGTDFVEFVGSYDLVLNPVLYRVYNAAHIIRQKFLI